MASEAAERDIVEIVKAIHVLASDVVAAGNLSKIGDTQFGRRAYVRAAFALIEGNINLMADVVLRAMDRGEVILTPKQIEILRQERKETAEGGTSVVRVKFVPVRDRIAPVFEMFSLLYGNSFNLDRGTSGWVGFCAAIELRNRITHPKNAASFDISGPELDSVERAREWFADSVETLLKACF